MRSAAAAAVAMCRVVCCSGGRVDERPPVRGQRRPAEGPSSRWLQILVPIRSKNPPTHLQRPGSSGRDDRWRETWSGAGQSQILAVWFEPTVGRQREKQNGEEGEKPPFVSALASNWGGIGSACKIRSNLLSNGLKNRAHLFYSACLDINKNNVFYICFPA